MLTLWMPLKIKENNNRFNTVIFDELGGIIPNNKGLRPFVIFYDDSQDCYYYLRARDAYIRDKRTKELIRKKNYKYEVEVHTHSESKLFSKDSLIDCSQIFKCNRELLESLVDLESEYYTQTKILDQYYIEELKNNLKDAIFEIPPYLSIIEVKVDDKGNTYGESLYLCDEKLDLYIEKDNVGVIDFYYDYNDLDINNLISTKSDNAYTNQRFNNGINFCKLFLEEYFENEIDEFNKLQGLDKTQDKEL